MAFWLRRSRQQEDTYHLRHQELFPKIKKILIEHLELKDIEKITPESRFIEDLGMDSLAQH